MKHLIIIWILLFVVHSNVNTQSAWPSSNWDVATNLSGIMSSQGVEGLSGVHYNPSKKQLFLVQDHGRLKIIQLNEQSGNHMLLTDHNLGGDLEGITQINDTDNEFWVIKENEHKIERYQYNNNFSSITTMHSWNLLLPQAGMNVTDNGGPEGICFVPDSYLQKSGFVSSVSGLPYTSQKGMGGLIFIAHQNQGKIWVYDINMNLNDDLILVGVYNSNRNESCGLNFDRSTGLLYILHNIDNNYLEITDLSVSLVGQQYKFNLVQEFNVTVPTDGSKNIEGVAVAPKCDDLQNPTLWLVRDASGAASAQVLKQFRPFGLIGDCEASSTQSESFAPLLYPNPSSGLVNFETSCILSTVVEIFDLNGRLVYQLTCESGEHLLDLQHLSKGMYFMKSGELLTKLVLL